MKRAFLILPLLAAGATLALAADQVGTGGRVINDYPAGSISEAAGLENWAKFYEVASHPRCANCHVGPENLPMWSGPSYGETRPHGMAINAGESRIGAEAVMCQTCHTTLKESRPDANTIPHAAPRVAMAWMLAPVEAEWFGKSSADICTQLKDPERNGNRSIRDVAAHLDHDLILHWAWNPGGTREPAPYSLQESMDFLMKWSAAGAPCPAS